MQIYVVTLTVQLQLLAKLLLSPSQVLLPFPTELETHSIAERFLMSEPTTEVEAVVAEAVAETITVVDTEEAVAVAVISTALIREAGPPVFAMVSMCLILLVFSQQKSTAVCQAVSEMQSGLLEMLTETDPNQAVEMIRPLNLLQYR